MTRDWNPEAADAIVAAHLQLEGPLLPILHAIQEEFGYISEDAMRLIANRLNITRAEVYGVVSFYHDYRQQPSGRHVLKLCRAEACQSMGGEANAAKLLERLGVDWGGTTADGRLTVEPIYCLGLCACAPSAMLDDEVHGRLDADSLEALAMEAV
ncbi:MAG: formate dehydrogenase subunit gamma [Acidocella sp. 20-57-95]|nr:MAG: formate dehydrogenase subunit gamma [Acidocella sp. 20-57-95]OYV58700.1 MAG: formate dehydrogenase subunit gamma [Acidocella sp. 21-58-7]HQT64884.1 formate dehydrogenase subunit gamma [Acidocella sp.]HQU04246.1 formate dehydrogenase subunit gamma [Acidocella sp.]